MNMDLWSLWDCISGSQEYWKHLCIGFINRSRVWRVGGDPILSAGYLRLHLEYLKRSHELGYIQRVRPRWWKILTSCYSKQRKKLWMHLDKTNWMNCSVSDYSSSLLLQGGMDRFLLECLQVWFYCLCWLLLMILWLHVCFWFLTGSSNSLEIYL